MGRGDALAAVRGICESIVPRHRLELVEVTLLGGGRGRKLTVIVDKLDEPVTINDVTAVSEEISRALDLEDPIDGSYTLEVSSAGIERPLVKPADYVRFTGREVKVRLQLPVEGRRNLQGVITRAGDETFVIEEPDSVVEVPYSSVARTKLVVDWDAELRKAGSAEQVEGLEDAWGGES